MKNRQRLAIPLVEERVSTSKRIVETKVRVRTRLEEHQQMVQAELARDHVDIQRVPMNLEISEVPDIRQVGETMVIPVVEEVLVVEKRLMLVEEIHVKREHGAEKITQPITTLKQRAEIERVPSPGDTTNTTTNQE
jgi:stress response protein YsnF